MKKCMSIISALLAVILISCASAPDQATADQKAIDEGVKAWNSREPEAAATYWNMIEDGKLQKQYLNYIDLYKAGVEALDSTDSIKATNEAKLLAACNTALDKFSALDPALNLSQSIRDKGVALSAKRLDALVASGKLTAARKLYDSTVKVYGTSDDLVNAHKEIDVVSAVYSRQNALKPEADKARADQPFEDKIAAYDSAIASYAKAEKDLDATAASAGVAKTAGVSVNIRNFKKLRQDLAIERASTIRERAYEYKTKIDEEFARTPDNGGDSGKMSLEAILAHYQSVQTNIEATYQDLLGFAAKYPNDIGQDILDDINAQKKDLEAKIAQVNSEIRTAQEIASRGKVVMPLMIGLFNPDPRSTAESQRSRPAKFSAKNAKGDEYWWGMVSIPRGTMNDLVITLKDNRSVRVFSENTKSGRLIEKNNMKDLVNRSAKVGNSWPVLNAGNQLTTNKYFFEIQKGKTNDYEGEVVVYSSFIVRMR
ncbi:hypothetical protein [Treponema parvum]|uniref:hypothetical protein n=1 Tax=Treponema parvum TaxID=138851 RepID=UPI001AEC50F3|nr:hypothetical protein [Treponema parvum]QTQ15780.1 hypothetical protein HXT04_03160 [Treponema parvum]